MKNKKKIIIIAVVIVAVVAIICGVLVVVKNKRENKKVVTVYSMSEVGSSGDMMGNQTTLDGNVTTSANQKVYLSSSQKIEEICVEEGQEVKTGDVLLKLDVTSANLALATKKTEVDLAKANVTLAENELTRLQNTTPVEPTTEAPPAPPTPPVDPDATPSDATTEVPTTEEPTTEDPGETYTREELDKAILDKQSEIKSLKIQAQLAEIQYQMLEYQSANGEVICNFDGTVKTVADPEEAILNNTPIIEVAGKTGKTITSAIGELSLGKINIGDTVTVTSYDSGNMYSGTITEVSDVPVEDGWYYSSNSESFYPLTIEVDGADDLTQGMYVSVALDNAYSGDADAIYVQLPYVAEENGQKYVYKDENGKLKKQVVQTGKTLWGYYVEIKSGLTMEDLIAFPYGDAEDGVKTKAGSVYDDSMMY